MVQTRSSRIKAPANIRFQNRTLLTPRQSYEVTTQTPPGRVVTDTCSGKKSPKCIRPTSELYITTYNACTLTKEFYLNELVNSMQKYNLAILCIQEHRLSHVEPINYHQLSSAHTLVPSSATLTNSNASIGGVRIVSTMKV